jgi:hypothetical protein
MSGRHCGRLRGYSRAAAYPDKPFPVTGSDTNCVLCQQPLSEEASKRLSSFEAFVQDESRRREQEAEAEYTKLLEEISSQAVSMNKLPAVIALIRDDVGQDDLAKTIRREILS